MAMALDALGIHWRGEGVEREWKWCCPEREKELFTPLHHGFSGRERCRGLEEYHMRLWYKFGLKEISGNGQNMHFKFLPERV